MKIIKGTCHRNLTFSGENGVMIPSLSNKIILEHQENEIN